MNFIILFIILSIINVIGSTARNIITIKGGRFVASITSGFYFAFYNVMLVYTVMDFPLWQKCIITFACNVIGVWIVKFCEEKLQKDKLWKVEATVGKDNKEDVCKLLAGANLPYTYIEGIGRYVIFNVFCETHKQSAAVREILNVYHAKYFASESKTL